MHNFDYVPENMTKPKMNDLSELMRFVQKYVEEREGFTFSYEFVGSSTMNMITYEKNGNIGYDFDINIEPIIEGIRIDAKTVHKAIFNALREYAGKYGYTHIEESTSVITIKAVDHYRSIIKFSCDFAIVRHYKKKKEKIQQYIRYNKAKGTYCWLDRGKGFYIEPKIKWLKKHNLWNEFRDYYLYKKNINENPDKHSRSIRAEAVNEMYWKYKSKIK
ncbi:hypothetical protein [Ruminococcus flavefaciens]|uniref:hypothetical protein n=1 Tax=Ruminococcus flavefaciens TaxID=1265 RepID=UPI0013D8FB9D|nr:hypothetical protein [Ruminococcus flavefaciens]